MEKRIAFCSACDRNVPVLVEAPDWTDRRPSIHDVEEAVVCLDYGVRCTGALCPMFRAPPAPPGTPTATPDRARSSP
ncbi:MAG TPA: hypothetical protein VF212_01640 [Longimicrobiales bacterium]